MRRGLLLLIFSVFIISGFSAIPLQAQDEDAGDYIARTVNNPEITQDNLALHLKPLFKEELEIEAAAWLDFFKTKIAEKSAVDLQALAAPDADKARLTEQSVEMGQAISALTGQVNTVMDALEAKGGDVEAYRAYIGEATGMDVGFDPQKIWIQAKSWIMAPTGGLAVGLNIVFFILTILAFMILSRILAGVTRKAVSNVKKSSELLKDFFVNSVRKVTFFIGLVIAVSFLGVDIGPFLAAIGVAGFVIGFALQDTLGNFAAGIMILLYRPYDIGDVVTVSGVTGKVDAMSLVSSTILTPDNQKVVVPNGSIWGGIITNITGNDQRRVDMVFGIGYSDDMGKAQTILEEILAGHKLILETPAPVIKVHELADSSVNYVVRPWCKTSDYWDVYWDVTRTVKERFDAEGVSIPFPQRDVHLFNDTSQA